MSKTVNGKSLSEVMKQLREKKLPKADKGDFKYFRINEFVQAFDSIIGISNYNVEYTDLKYSQISTGQEKYSVKCRISILSDDGDVLLIRESYGDYTCQYEKKTGKDVNLQNSSEFACHAAFKNAAKRFGIFGRYADVFDTDSSECKPVSNRSASSNDCIMNFRTDGSFEKIDEKDGRPIYRINVHEKVGENDFRKETAQIIFYPNQYSKEADHFNQCFELCKSSPRRIRVKVKYTRDNGTKKQYVFKAFVPAS